MPALQPGGQRVALPDSYPAEIEYLKLAAAPGAQTADAPEGLEIVVEGRTDENADLEIIATSHLLPIIKPVNKPFEAPKRKGAALSRFRDQTISTDVGARRVAQR